MTDLQTLFETQGGVATSAQLLEHLTRSRLDRAIAGGELIKVWPGVYSGGEPDVMTKLRGLDLRAGAPVAICLGTAAAAYGFDIEDTVDLHVLTPPGHQLRDSDGLIVHRRDGAPLSMVDGRLATSAPWTAVEVARSLHRPAPWPLWTPRCAGRRAIAASSRRQRRGRQEDAASSRCGSSSLSRTHGRNPPWRAKCAW